MGMFIKGVFIWSLQDFYEVDNFIRLIYGFVLFSST